MEVMGNLNMRQEVRVDSLGNISGNVNLNLESEKSRKESFGFSIFKLLIKPSLRQRGVCQG